MPQYSTLTGATWTAPTPTRHRSRAPAAAAAPDPVHRRRTPLLHLRQRNRLTGVAAVPTPEVTAEVGHLDLGVIQLVVDVLPLIDRLGLLCRRCWCAPGTRRRSDGQRRRRDAPPPRPATPAGTASRVFSISPNSKRCPRSLTWASARPRYSNCPPQSSAPDPPCDTSAPRHHQRVGHEPIRGQLRPAHISAGHTRPTQIQLADHPDRRRVSRASSTSAHTPAIGTPIPTGCPAASALR